MIYSMSLLRRRKGTGVSGGIEVILVDPNENARFKGMEFFDELNVPYKVWKKQSGLWDFAIVGQKLLSNGKCQEKTIMIERKTWFDLLSSAQSRDHHLKQQLTRLAKAKDREANGVIVIPALLIEGSVASVLKSVRYRKYYSWSDERIHALEGGLYAGWSDKIQFYSSSSPRRTVMLLAAMNNNLNTDAKKWVPYRITDPGPAHTPQDEAFNMIMGKIGIGGDRCLKLFNKFGSVKNIVSQTEKELQSVVGNKTGSDLYQIVNLWFSDESEQTIISD